MMRQMWKRVTALVLGGMLAAAPAMAQENTGLVDLIEQVRTLAFDTQNVTATLNAEFSWDGTLFKSGSASRKQDGGNSLTEVTLTTPRAGKEDYVGSYTVYTQGRKSYSTSSYNNDEYYNEMTANPRSTLLRTNRLRNGGLSLLSNLAGMVELGITSDAQGKQTTWTLAEGGMPAIINQTLSYMMTSELRRLGYPNDETSYGPYVYYEDGTALMTKWMEDNTPLSDEDIAMYVDGSDVPEEKQETLWTLMNQYYDYVNGLVDSADTEDDVVYVYADGTVECFASINDYLKAINKVEIVYENMDKAITVYYNHVVDSKLTAVDAVQKVEGMDYPDYTKFRDSMDAYYQEQVQAQNPNAVAAYLKENGEFTIFEDYDMLGRMRRTQKEQIFNDFVTGEVKQAEVTTTVDEQGRLTRAEGTVIFSVIDRENAAHDLTVKFTATADAYGTTAFDLFDPDTSTIPSLEEYYNNYDEYSSID